MNSPDDSDQLQPPFEKIGRYEVRQELGSGGFGTVYAGYDGQLDRSVAIKVPLRLQTTERINEFLSEARRLAQLQHPGIVAIYDVGSQEEYCYIVTELVEGETLSSHLRSRTFTWQETCNLVAQVADALAHAHSKSMIHRDIKPGNIMIRPDGCPVVLDFGLALTDSESTGPTGTMQGTPGFMAPEQVRGQAHRVDGRTDIYSLGVVLYQMLAGRTPFRSKNIRELLRRVVEEEPQPVRQLNSQVPPEVASICTRAMAKKMSNRYVTALDFSAALRTAIPAKHSLDVTLDHATASAFGSHELSDLPADPHQPLESDSSLDATMDNTPRTGFGSTIRRARSAVMRRITVAVISIEGSIDDDSLDTEQDYELVQQIQKISTQCIGEYGGVSIAGSGRDIVSCFGYPVAYEDAAPRAIRAIREVINRMRDWSEADTIQPGISVESWALIHSGDAVVEDRGGESTDAISLSGDALNTAKKLAPTIDGNMVVVTAATKDLAGDVFEYGEPESRKVRGMKRPIEVFPVIKEVAVTNRVELVDPGNLTPLVGRDTELAILKDRWEQASEGMGQVVLLIGDAGLGKSRLIREIREFVSKQPDDPAPVIIELRCSAYHQNTGFFPLVEYFARLLDFQSGISQLERWSRLTDYLTLLDITDSQEVALLATMLGVSIPADCEPLTIPPQRVRESTQELLLKWLRLQGERAPVLFIVEDLHWADPTGLDVLRRHVEEFEAESILTVLTFRPEFQTPWRSLGHQTQIALNRLTKRQIGQMLQGIEGREAPSWVVQQVIDRTDGIPLFVEEVAKLIDESELPAVDVTKSQLSAMIPASLQDLLAARLDRIESDLDVVQLASTIGREFDYELLNAASDLSAENLNRELRILTEAEILFQKGQLPNAKLIFKHALIQDSAYQSMLTKRRTEFHLRIARVLEDSFPEVAESQPELLAQHFTAGAELESGIEYWRKAGMQAQAACTNDEAIRNFRLGLEVLQRLPESPERDAMELQFQIPLATTIMTSKGYAHPDLNAVHARARQLCEQLGGDAPLFHVIWGIWAVQLILDEMETTKRLAAEILKLAVQSGDPGLQMEGWFCIAITSFFRAEFTACREACERCSELEDRETCRAHSVYTGQNAGMAYRCYWALSDWYLGQPDSALTRMEDAIRFARDIDHPFSLAYALHHAGWLYSNCQLGDKALEVGQECVTRSNEQGFAFWSALGTVNLGTGRMVNGDFEAALEYVQTGLQSYLLTGSLKSIAEYRGFLGEILLDSNPPNALIELEGALEVAQRTGNRCYYAELLRLKGEALLLMDPADTEQVEQCFMKSIEVARQQKARCWQLRTSVSLARLWATKQKSAEAKEMLTTIYEEFTEGFSTPDLKNAHAVIQQLSN